MKQCFIHTNTPLVRQRLLNEGIKLAHLADRPERSYGLLYNGKVVIGTPYELDIMTIDEYIKRNNIYDCGTDVDNFIKTISKIQEEKMEKEFYQRPQTQQFFKQYHDLAPSNDAELKAWIQRNKSNLLKAENLDFFQIYKNQDGQQYIKMLGYFYKADNEWRLVTFGGYELPLKQYLNNEDKWSIWEEQSRQYVKEIENEEELLMIFVKNYSPISIRFSELDTNTPEGIYM